MALRSTQALPARRCSAAPALRLAPLSVPRAMRSTALPARVQRARCVQAKASMEEPVEESVAASSQSAQVESLRQSAGWMKNLSFCAFWLQLALSMVSAGILVFSVAVVPGAARDVSKYLTLAGVIFAFISTFFASTFLGTARKLLSGGSVLPGFLSGSLLANNTMNLVGIAVTVVGLQASVGTLVGKALMSAASGPTLYAQQSASVISLDVFALQALSNTLLCHTVALLFTNLMMRTVNKALKAQPA